MREIIFDTETTGLDCASDRIIEFGAVELVNRFPTGRTYHAYINPQGRSVHPEALAIHGLANDFLADKPTFDQIVPELLDFVGDAALVAHNAAFDLGFINAELARINLVPIAADRVVDTLWIARRKHPMGPNSLDALCRRYGVDNAHRTKHGALLDSELLAEVYIELIGGKQAALILEAEDTAENRSEGSNLVMEMDYRRPRELAPRLSVAELEAHSRLVARIGDKALWLPIDQRSENPA